MIGVTDGVVLDVAPMMVDEITFDTYVGAAKERFIAIGYPRGDVEIAISYQEARVLHAWLETALGIKPEGT